MHPINILSLNCRISFIKHSNPKKEYGKSNGIKLLKRVMGKESFST